MTILFFRIWFDDTQPKPYTIELLEREDVRGVMAPVRFKTAMEAKGWRSLQHPGAEEVP